MRSFSATLLLAAVASVSATTLLRRQQSPYPDCALPCLVAAMEGECAGDVACLCRDEAFVVGSTECIATSCEGDDLENANRVARESCASVGVNLEEQPTDSATPSDAEESDSAPAPSDSNTAPATEETSATPEDEEETPEEESAALSTGASTFITLTAVGLVSLVL
ncbi:hypothetical protein BDV98DRAFT_652421 [Pterulicium gracile]|uniref:CFEM domain-containing protein n=1 Tax=Pterulicium gracile TaxID=1884261 RepID=A0A5C3QZJ2_9AGAR|nr:hypothetical protein BDV98DRAFT_652421 [Pterula gracilis]